MPTRRLQTGETPSAFRHLLPPPPALPGDLLRARLYLHAVRKLRYRGGWTAAEAERLRRLERLWERRAVGRDGWYMVVGLATAQAATSQRERLVWWRALETIQALVQTQEAVADRG